MACRAGRQIVLPREQAMPPPTMRMPLLAAAQQTQPLVFLRLMLLQPMLLRLSPEAPVAATAASPPPQSRAAGTWLLAAGPGDPHRRTAARIRARAIAAQCRVGAETLQTSDTTTQSDCAKMISQGCLASPSPAPPTELWPGSPSASSRRLLDTASEAALPPSQPRAWKPPRLRAAAC